MRVDQVPRMRRSTVEGKRRDRIRVAMAENVFCLGGARIQTHSGN